MIKLTRRKGFNFFRSYYDVYNELSDSDKIAFMDALLDRQFLGVKPSNLNGMAKFAYISQTNSIDSQVRGYEDKTGIKLTPTVGGKDTPTEQVEEKGKGKEQVEDIVPTFSFKSSLIELGVETETVDTWLMIRKKKKAVNSEIAFKGLLKQIELATLSPSECILMACENSWSGFRAEWVKNKNLNNGTTEKLQRQADFLIQYDEHKANRS